MALSTRDGLMVRQGESTEAFERLFIQEYRRVVAIAYRIVNDPQEAEDVAQDVFASFHRTQHAESTHASAWLHRASAHLALNAVRARNRRRRRESSQAMIQARTDPGQGLGADPAAQVEASERRSQARATLARLPKRTAAVLALRYSGLSYGEVASALDCKINQVGTLLRRAEEAFRKEYNRETH